MHSCDQCSKVYQQRQSLYRHKKSCPGKSYSANRKNHEINKSELFKQLKEVGDKEKLQTPAGQQESSDRLDIEEENSILGDDNKSEKESGSDVSSDSSGIKEEHSILEDDESESDVSSAEDEEDENMDKKVWHVILHHSNKNDCNPLEAFKDFCRWCRALKKDPIIKKVIDSAHVSRDENTGFKKALNEALNKRKFLILRAIGENRDGIVWDELEGDPDVLESLRRHILFSRAMKRDPTFQSVMEYKDECMEDEDMDSDEALDHSIDEKSTDIIEACTHHGKGLYLHPYGKGLGAEKEETAKEIWKMIAREYQTFQHDPFSYVRYFVRLQDLIEQDETFEVLEKIKTYMEHSLPFEKALDKSVEEEKTLIHKAFASNDELWRAMKEDELGDDKEDLDVFKTYVVYYQSLMRDNVFQAIVNDMNLAVEAGMPYEQALDWSIEENKTKIKKAMKIPKPWSSYIPGLNV